jgi:hypothetical protein
MKLAFCDTETTGLDPDRHEIWEVGLIVREFFTDPGKVTDSEYRWLLPVDLGTADPYALKVGQFHSRHWQGYEYTNAFEILKGCTIVDDLRTFAGEFARLTQGAHLVGSVISFDEERLRKLLRANDACPEWHYHLVDVEALAAAHLAANADEAHSFKCDFEPPWDSEQLSLGCGIDPTEFPRHTALGDAYWARAIYDAVMTNRDVQYPEASE